MMFSAGRTYTSACGRRIIVRDRSEGMCCLGGDASGRRRINKADLGEWLFLEDGDILAAWH